MQPAKTPAVIARAEAVQAVTRTNPHGQAPTFDALLGLN
jgi:hypothetical protein